MDPWNGYIDLIKNQPSVWAQTVSSRVVTDVAPPLENALLGPGVSDAAHMALPFKDK